MLAKLRLPLALLGFTLLALGCKPKIGDSCKSSTDCSAQADRLCDTTQPGGYCTLFNCEPGTCPEDESVCVAFNDTICDDPLRTPRFQRTFCMARCDDDGDCRAEYECVDMGAAVVDIDPPTRKVCLVKREARPEVDAGSFGVCEPPPDGGFPVPEPFPSPGSSDGGAEGGAEDDGEVVDEDDAGGDGGG